MLLLDDFLADSNHKTNYLKNRTADKHGPFQEKTGKPAQKNRGTFLKVGVERRLDFVKKL